MIQAVRKKGGWYSVRNSVLILMLYCDELKLKEAAHLR